MTLDGPTPREGAALLGPAGRDILRAIEAARDFLAAHSEEELLERVGDTIEEVPAVEHLSKEVFQASYGGRKAGPPDDILTGLGHFFITEQRRLYLDCTGGHYQMTWGYRHPVLCAALAEAERLGIVWDAHSNIPGATVKSLSYRLVELCNPGVEGLDRCDATGVDGPDRLNTVLLGICTGSVACSTALKIMLARHRERTTEPPVVITLEGNYHGTDIFAQSMRGMWPGLIDGAEFVNLEPNDLPAAEAAFRRYGSRVMGFMCEPVMMNREAILVEGDYMRRIRELCDEADVLLAVDEIQTGFWEPGCFHFKRWGITPDLVICGKGMAAGIHPLSAVIYRRPLDVLAQYDSISTNGNAPLAAYVALHSIDMIEGDAERIAAAARATEAMATAVAEEFPDRVKAVHGSGHLTGLKFHRVEDALRLHQRCVERGVWVRAHAYHEGHSTVLCKFALTAGPRAIEFLGERYRDLLAQG